MIYLLNIKESLSAQGKKFIYSVLPLKAANIVVAEFQFIKKAFSGFIIGKLIDSLIIGILCFILMHLFKLPYELLISVIIGVTNVIPFFGPFIGAAPCAILVFLISPKQCLYFIGLILVLQQFDGNILGPKILGNSTGVSSFGVLFSILLFGGLCGFVGMIIAVKSAGALQAAGFTGIPLMIFFILLCCVVNLFMTSGTAKWYIFAPILVPMMMMLGYSPEFAQVVYRIGDSTTNAITPIYPYIPIAIAMAKKYDKNFGMGSLISMMLPYSVAFLLGWIVQLVIWVTLNLPIGPGAYVFM